MKTSKQIKILAGVTRVRIHLCMTQQMLADYLGVSKSLISMVENGNRHLSGKPLEMICQLEKDYSPITADTASRLEMIEVVTTGPVDRWQEAQHKIQQLRLQEVQYEYTRMMSRYEQLAVAEANLRHLVNLTDDATNSKTKKILEFQRHKLDQQLRRYNYAVRTKKRYELALLEDLVLGEQKEKPRLTKKMIRRRHLPHKAA